MKIIRIIVWTCIGTALLEACTHEINKKNDFPVQVLQIDPTDVENFIDLSPILEDSLEIIPLETTDQCLIANVKKVEFCNGKVFVLDDRSRKIFIFNQKGKYLNSIGKQGVGPGEYQYLYNFEITGSSIFVQDLYARKYYVYDINDESYENYDEITYSVHHLALIPFQKSLYFISGYFKSELGYYNLFKLNLKTHDMEAFLPFDKKYNENNSAFGLFNYSDKYSDKALLIQALSDTIYEVDERGICPIYRVQFTSNIMPKSLKEKEASIISRSVVQNDYITGLNYIQNSQDYVFANYSIGKKRQSLLIEKRTGSCKVGNELVIGNLGNMRVDNYSTTENDEFIFIPLAYVLQFNWKNIYSMGSFENTNDKTKISLLIDSITEDSNPALFKYKFRKIQNEKDTK